MNPKAHDLVEKYPAIFKGGYPRSGIYIPEGWYPLMEMLCPILENHVLSLPPELQSDLYVVQIKEKFGGLRFYMNQSTPFMDGAISLAENMSVAICETCGSSGQRRGGGYIQTLCDKHHKAKEKAEKAKKK